MRAIDPVYDLSGSARNVYALHHLDRVAADTE
ncbi:hypothetical protein ABIA33_003742 [Streptacidiphilus sp. MAP12-16]